MSKQDQLASFAGPPIINLLLGKGRGWGWGLKDCLSLSLSAKRLPERKSWPFIAATYLAKCGRARHACTLTGGTSGLTMECGRVPKNSSAVPPFIFFLGKW